MTGIAAWLSRRDRRTTVTFAEPVSNVVRLIPVTELPPRCGSVDCDNLLTDEDQYVCRGCAFGGAS